MSRSLTEIKRKKFPTGGPVISSSPSESTISGNNFGAHRNYFDPGMDTNKLIDKAKEITTNKAFKKKINTVFHVPNENRNQFRKHVKNTIKAHTETDNNTITVPLPNHLGVQATVVIKKDTKAKHKATHYDKPTQFGAAFDGRKLVHYENTYSTLGKPSFAETVSSGPSKHDKAEKNTSKPNAGKKK